MAAVFASTKRAAGDSAAFKRWLTRGPKAEQSWPSTF
jgi:hypothetical protein